MDSNVWSKQIVMGTSGDLVTDWNNASVSGDNLSLLATYNATTSKYSVANTLTTKGNMSFKYGKLEMRAKVPFGAGAFPSLWLSSKGALGGEENPLYNAEIDIFEVFASDGTADSVVANAHKHYTADTENDNAQYKWYTNSNLTLKVADPNAYHIFTFEWTPETMTAAIDGVVYMEIDLSQNFDYSAYVSEYGATDMSQFHQPMHIMINNHMFTPGNAQYIYKYTGTEAIVTPIEYDIDYIRLYQKSSYGSQLYVN